MKRLKLFFACLLMAVLSIGQVWGAADVTYDFTGSEWSVSDGTLTDGTVSFTGAAAGTKGSFKMNSGYLMLGKQNAYLNFPTYSKAVEKIVITGRSGASTSTKQNIYVGTTAVSEETTSSATTQTYNIASNYQAAGTTYTFTVTSDHNAQITKIEIFYVSENPGSGDNPGGDEPGGDEPGGDDPTPSSDNLELTFDVSSNPGTGDAAWPTTNSYTQTNYTYTLNEVDYTFDLHNVKCNSGYLMLTAAAQLGLPAIEGYKLVKIEAKNSSGCSMSTKVRVTSSATDNTKIVSGGSEQTWSTQSSTYTYTLSDTEANTMYYLWIANKNCQIIELKLYYDAVGDAPAVAKPTITGTDNFFSSTTVTISQNDADHIYYTTDGNAPTTSSDEYTTPFSINATKTVKAIAVKGSDVSDVASATFTKATILTVAQALAATPAANQYVTGVVASVTEVSTEHGNATYTLKDAGEDNSIIIYRGKYLDNAAFTSEDQIIEGDEVTVFGEIKTYSQVNQFTTGNYIVAMFPKARLTWSANSFTADIDDSENAFPTLTNNNGVTVTYSSSDPTKAEINENTGAITLHEVGENITITATFAGNTQYKANSASYTLNIGSSVAKGNITYNCDGATTCPEDVLNATNLPEELPVVTKAGKNFGGWFTDANKTVPAVAGAAISSDVTLYAKWNDPYTVAEALAIIDALADNAVTEDNVYAAGIVCVAPTAAPNSGKLTYYISADGDSESDQLQVYLGYGVGGANFTAQTDIQVGDEVVVYGKLKRYVKSNVLYPEFDKANQLFSFNRPVVAVESVNLTESASGATVEEGKTVTLHASVVPANAANKTIVWSVQSGSDYASVADGVVTGIAEGTAVIRAASDEDATIYAECTVTVTAPVPPHTYDVDVDLAFATIGDEGWESSYAAHTVDNTTYEVVFASASKQASTIDDVPVVKNTTVQLKLKSTTKKYITAVKFDCRQWSSKTQTIELKYSTDNGETYTAFDPAITSSEFELEKLELPEKVNALQIQGSENNQIGIAAIHFDWVDKPIITKTVTITAPAAEEGTLVVKNGDDAITSGDAIEVGTTLTIVATANIDYSLSGVSVKDEDNDDVTVTSNTFVVPNKNVTVSATFISDPRPVPTIAIDPMALKFGDEVAIVPTVTVAEASAVTYAIKEGSDDCITLAGSTITAKSVEGTATIIASIAATDDYKAASTEFAVTVSDPRKKATGSASFAAVSGDLNDDIAYASYQGEGTTTPAITKDGYIRLYKISSTGSYGGYITFSAAKGCAIDQVVLTVGSNASVAYCKNDEAIPTTGGQSVSKDAQFETLGNLNAESVSIVNLHSSNALDIKAITVYYTGDPLPVDHYILGGTYETNFEQNGTFSYEGLTVTASYDAGETITEPVVGFTVVADLTTAGDKKAEVYLGETKLTEYDIHVAAGKENPALAYTPNELTIEAAEIASWEAPAFSNTFGVTPTFSSNNTSVATVTNEGVIALAGGYGTAVITAHFDETPEYIESEATYTITVNEPADVCDATDDFSTATNTSASSYDVERSTTDGWSSVNSALTTINSEARWLTMLGKTSKVGVITSPTLNDGIGSLKVRYANTFNESNGVSFKVEIKQGEEVVKTYTITKANADVTKGTVYTEEIKNINVAGDFQIVITNLCPSEADSNKDRVSIGRLCWTNYEEVTPPTPDYGSYNRDGLTPGNYATICLPNGGTMSNNAKLFDLDYYDGANTLYLLEVNGNAMVAGRPYIFLPSETSIEVTYTDNVNAVAGSFRGLVGSYTEETVAIGTGDEANYILWQNAYYLVNSAAKVGANRAYIHMAGVLTVPTPQVDQAPRRRVAMTVHGTQTATGMDELNASEAPVKVIIDGQLFIIRGEQMFNANGQLVK